MIRVCLVEDQTIVREGLKTLLELAPDIEVVAEAADGDEALEVIPRHDPDVVLLDMRLPKRNGPISRMPTMASAISWGRSFFGDPACSRPILAKKPVCTSLGLTSITRTSWRRSSSRQRDQGLGVVELHGDSPLGDRSITEA